MRTKQFLQGVVVVSGLSGLAIGGCGESGSTVNDLGGAGLGSSLPVAGDGASAGVGGELGSSGVGGDVTGTAGDGVGMAGTGAAGSGSAGTGAAGSGSAGTGAAGSGSAGTSADMDLPPCTTKPSQVAIFGDSYINWGTHTFGADLAKEAGETWRMHAVGGFSMGSGGIGLIPPTLAQAVQQDPDIKAAVMDGGGNDILIPAATWPGGADCKNRADSPTLKVCQDIVKTALDAADKMMMDAATAGIRDVVYFFYPHVPEPTTLGGQHPNAILDYALPLAKAMCDGAEAKTSGKLRCHFLDLVPVFAGKTGWFAAGDIHENSTGSAAMAKEVWQIMKDNCIAQKPSSGCCKP